MADSLGITVKGVFIANVKNNTMRIPSTIILNQNSIDTTSMIDSGTGGEFIDFTFANSHHLPLQQLHIPLPVLNTDKTPNHRGNITHETVLRIRLPDGTT